MRKTKTDGQDKTHTYSNWVMSYFCWLSCLKNKADFENSKNCVLDLNISDMGGWKLIFAELNCWLFLKLSFLSFLIYYFQSNLVSFGA